MTTKAALLTSYEIAAGAFAWWSEELIGMLPERARGILNLVPVCPVLDVSGDQIVLSWISSRKNGELVHVSRKSSEDMAHVSQAIRRALGSQSKQVIVRLPESAGLVTRLRLPRVQRAKLQQILRYEIDRHTPFTRDEVYFDYEILPHVRHAKHLDVELAVAPRETVDHAVELARQCGLSVQRVGLMCGAGRSPARFSLGSRQRAASGGWMQRLTWSLVGVAFALSLLASYSWSTRQEVEAAELGRRIAQAKLEAAQAERLRAEIDRLIKQSQFFGQQKQAPWAIKTLAELSNLIPSDTWVTELELHGREVRISGFSPAAARLVGLVEASSAFENARFRSPVTQGPNGNLERFDLSFAVTFGATQ